MRRVIVSIAISLVATGMAADSPVARERRVEAPVPTVAAFPSDGNGLLDYCSHIVSALDSKSSEAAVGDSEFTENVFKFAWCSGYIEATRKLIDSWRMTTALQVMAATNSHGALPAFPWADEYFRDICIPEQVSTGQLARVLTKWLRDHPERLHEPDYLLTREALKSAFPAPCSATGTKP